MDSYHYYPHQLLAIHHNSSTNKHATDLSRLLDPSYASSSSSSKASPSYATRAYVDHNGELHDPDYRHFPSISTPHRRSTNNSGSNNLRPAWETAYGFGYDEEALEDEDAEIGEENLCAEKFSPEYGERLSRQNSPHPYSYNHHNHSSKRRSLSLTRTSRSNTAPSTTSAAAAYYGYPTVTTSTSTSSTSAPPSPPSVRASPLHSCESEDTYLSCASGDSFHGEYDDDEERGREKRKRSILVKPRRTSSSMERPSYPLVEEEESVDNDRHGEKERKSSCSGKYHYAALKMKVSMGMFRLLKKFSH